MAQWRWWCVHRSIKKKTNNYLRNTEKQIALSRQVLRFSGTNFIESLCSSAINLVFSFWAHEKWKFHRPQVVVRIRWEIFMFERIHCIFLSIWILKCSRQCQGRDTVARNDDVIHTQKYSAGFSCTTFLRGNVCVDIERIVVFFALLRSADFSTWKKKCYSGNVAEILPIIFVCVRFWM